MISSAIDHGRALENIRQARKRRLVAVLVAYGDDSSDKTRKRVFAAATIVGRQKEWDVFELDWKRKNGDRPFHAADCDSDHGDFKHTTHESNKILYADNVRLLTKSPFIGSAIAISIADFNELLPGSVEEWPYYLCFLGAVMRATTVGRLSIPPEPTKVTFDRNFDRDYSTANLYDFMVKHERWNVSRFLSDEISFADHRSSIGVQAADLVAREAMKYLDNRLASNPRRTRQSFAELYRSSRFRFEFAERPLLELTGPVDGK